MCARWHAVGRAASTLDFALESLAPGGVDVVWGKTQAPAADLPALGGSGEDEDEEQLPSVRPPRRYIISCVVDTTKIDADRVIEAIALQEDCVRDVRLRDIINLA